MKQTLLDTFANYPRACITEGELAFLLGGTTHSLHSKIKRWVAQGKLIRLRRGLYCLTRQLGYLKLPHPFELSQYMYATSYVSLESALSYHQLIPEAVYTTTSVCFKRAKEFKTPLGVFSYATLPNKEFFTEVTRVADGQCRFFIAKPWKAICDYVYCYKMDWHSIEPLIESLRIDEEDIPTLSSAEFELLDEYYQRSRLTRFLKGVRKDLALLHKYN